MFLGEMIVTNAGGKALRNADNSSSVKMIEKSEDSATMTTADKKVVSALYKCRKPGAPNK